MHTQDTQLTLRWIAGVGGAGIVAAVTAANVGSTGGIASTTAPALIAHAAGLVIGAACIGAALRSDRRTLSALIALALVAGEAYTLMSTGERELEGRDMRQAPIKRADAKRKTIEAEIAKAESALAGLSSERLKRAEQVLGRIELSAIEASAKRDCVRLCKQRLDDSVASARRDVEAARAELDAERAAIMAKIHAHKADIAEIPAVTAFSPLAARLGVADWKLDLIRAALFTLSANGLGALLLVFATHTGGRRNDIVSRRETVSEHPLTDAEIEQIRRILEGRSAPATNDELAALAGVSKSEMSKRVAKAVQTGTVVKLRRGRYNAISLAA